MKLIYKGKIVGDSTNYIDAVDKSTINNVNLEGHLTTEGVKFTWYGNQFEYDQIANAGEINEYTLYIINEDESGPEEEKGTYLDLVDLPKLNGVILSNDSTLHDIDTYSKEEIEQLISESKSIEVTSEGPLNPLPATLYYIGPDSEGDYVQVLYDNDLNEINLGQTGSIEYSGIDGLYVDEDAYVVGHTNKITPSTTQSMKLFANDKFGHVTSVSDLTPKGDLQITNNTLGHVKQDVPEQTAESWYSLAFDAEGHVTDEGTTAYALGADLTDVNNKIGHANTATSGSQPNYNVHPVLKVDAFGHIQTMTREYAQAPWWTISYSNQWGTVGYARVPMAVKSCPLSYILNHGPIVCVWTKDQTYDTQTHAHLSTSYYTTFDNVPGTITGTAAYDVWRYEKATNGWTKVVTNQTSSISGTNVMFKVAQSANISYKTGDVAIICLTGDLG